MRAACAAFLLVLALRLLAIALLGADVPFWDEWDLQVDQVLRRGPQAAWDLGLLASGHNEHRPVWARLEVAAELGLWGQWRPTRSLAFNSLLWASCGALWVALWRRLAPRGETGAVALALLLFASPMTYRNALWSMQGAFASLALALLIAAAAGSARRLSPGRAALSILAGILAAGSLGSAPLAPGAFALARLAAAGASPRGERRRPLSEAGIALLAALLLATQWTAPAPHHAELHAQGILAFASAALRALGWPHKPVPYLGLALLWLPWLLIALTWRRPWRHPGLRLMGSLAGALAVNALALAWARGGAGDVSPQPRHAELLLLAAGPAAYAWRMHARRGPPSLRRAAWLLLGVLVLVLILRAGRALPRLVKEGGERRVSRELCQDARRLLRADSAIGLARLEAASRREGLPHPRAARIAELLADPAVDGRLSWEEPGRASWVSPWAGALGLILAGACARRRRGAGARAGA